MIKALMAVLIAAAACLAMPSTGKSAGTDTVSSPARDSDVVELPPFVVEATRIDRPWRYASIPGFEILSECDDTKTRWYIRGLLLGANLEKRMVPAGVLTPLSAPNTVVLYESKTATNSTASLIPDRLGTEDDDKIVWGRWAHGHMAGSTGTEDLDTRADCLNLWDRPIDFPLAATKGFPFRLLHRVPTFPNWFLQGLVGPFGIYKVNPKIGYKSGHPFAMILPTAEWISDAETESIRQNRAPATPLLPLEQFFVQDASESLSPSQVWLSEASLFVRWGMYCTSKAPQNQTPQGLRDQHQISEAETAENIVDIKSQSHLQEKFWNFLNQAATKPATEQMVHECFGFGFVEMKRQLEAYLPYAVNRVIKVPLRDSDQAEPDLRDATEAEIARIVGDWERIKGDSLKTENSKLSRQYLEAAGITLLKPYTKGNRDTLLLSVIGLYEQAVGDGVKAREFLESASQGQVVRPSAYLTLEQLRYRDFEAHPAGVDGKFSAGQMSALLSPLFAARKLPPAMVETYRLIADAWARSAVKPKPGNLAVLDEGERLFWSDSDFSAEVEKLRVQWGYPPMSAH